MNTDILKGNWEKMKGSVQKQWGKLTNDDLDVIEGESRILIGKLQERYGYTREEAEKEVETWNNS